MAEYRTGQEYDISHTRKGNFRIKIVRQRSSLLTGVITKGFARYLSEPNRTIGDQITIDTLSRFVKITKPTDI